MISKGWKSAGHTEGTEWEIKERPKYILIRPVGDYTNDDPHCRVDFDGNGGIDLSTFHSNFNGYFGTREVVSAAITVALGL
jgi:hypothetical protein